MPLECFFAMSNEVPIRDWRHTERSGPDIHVQSLNRTGQVGGSVDARLVNSICQLAGSRGL